MADKKVSETKTTESKVKNTSPAPKAEKKTEVKSAGLTVKVYDIKGKESGTLTLPKEIFGQTPNKNLLSQAIRVYSSNLLPNTHHTKTRGEVRGGGIKPWKQKGTGRARAGSRRSPLWVGGGITFGPRANKAKLTMPLKMRQKALIYALSTKAQAGQVKVIANFEKTEPKTKPTAAMLKSLEVKNKTLFVVAEANNNVKLATRNIPKLTMSTPSNLNAYEVMKNNQLLLSTDSVAKFKI